MTVKKLRLCLRWPFLTFEPLSKLAGWLRLGFQGKSLKNFKLLSVNDEAPAITEVTAAVDIVHDNKSFKKEIQVRMIYEDGKSFAQGWTKREMVCNGTFI